MTTPVSAAGPTGPAQVAPTGTESADKDMFMKLLVAQLKYQNPMAPTDGNQYMNQMAVFTQVEKLGQLVEAQQAAQVWQQRLAAEAGVVAVHTGVVTSVSFGEDGPLLKLADGSTVAVGDVSTVELQK